MSRTMSDDQAIDSLAFGFRVLLWVVCILAVAMVLLTLLLGGLSWYTFKKVENVEREYFAATDAGNLWKLTPLGQPVGGRTKVVDLSSKCIRKMTALNYVDFKRQLTEAEVECFTGPGYQQYESELKRNKIYASLEDGKQKLVMTGEPGPGEFLSYEPRLYGGVQRQTYVLRHPLTIVFNGNVTRPWKGFIEVDLIRIDQREQPDGYAINAVRILQK
ncbi:DotI/IcmL family type IV secretion protein [Pseudomonas aeruginosa]|uniref:DotI/IcmL family type IV secretion protein n=1 Tax=Pseudomonas aeruginosa group TaxID=136841 RepID=UPI0005B4D2E6|nr:MULTISPECIES: DotI/IcmL family type IV secretion protein [Pseudomonas aeruginosa group]EIU1445493.1 DotI/IcmL family type IV secretion protein [Pseudomonas aeruginosa]EKV2975719.1 DotI/IcmL family type IV secretion protein [Pseudomonas aeruginosa]EKV3160374.1 DotI/IcmL family type IV secretion protein [Pseudomonas aeruginosa]EKW6212588.1 DotI/IcmL family type IV secretion protein [Pseudomonas aeruginosa]EKW7604488.1 DotI/IcmL family type IV secretion protein [Pseudomonas aeruginosa]